MAIKVPDNFRPSDYGIELSIPKPDIECSNNKDGSFSMYARYSCDISEFAREAAREIKDKMEAELIDELLRMNGYVPERTCEMPMVFEDDEGNELDSSAAYFRYYRCSNCGEIMEHYKHEHWSYCPNCGAKVVE